MTPPPRGRGSKVFRNQEWRVLVDRLGLSPREAEITQRVFDGLGEAAIARDLGIAPATVHTYVGRLYRKLDVKSRGELMTLVFSEFLKASEAGGRRALGRLSSDPMTSGQMSSVRRLAAY